jgi:hypothetical protein
MLQLLRSSLHQQHCSYLGESFVDQSTGQPTKVLSDTCDRETKVYLSVQIQLCSMSGVAESEISKCPRLVAEPIEGRCDGHSRNCPFPPGHALSHFKSDFPIRLLFLIPLLRNT